MNGVMMEKVAESSPHNRWICDVPKNAREVYRLQLTTFKGHDLATIRVFYRVDGSDELRPGKSGIAVRVERLVELQSAVSRVIDAARTGGLLPPEAGR